MNISDAIREASETTGLMKRGEDYERYNGAVYYAVDGYGEIRRVSRWGVEKWTPKAEELVAADWETAEMHKKRKMLGNG